MRGCSRGRRGIVGFSVLEAGFPKGPSVGCAGRAEVMRNVAPDGRILLPQAAGDK